MLSGTAEKQPNKNQPNNSKKKTSTWTFLQGVEELYLASGLIQISHLCLLHNFCPQLRGLLCDVSKHTHTHPSLDHFISLPPTTRGRSCHNVWVFGFLAPTASSLKGGAFPLLALYGLSVESQATPFFFFFCLFVF